YLHATEFLYAEPHCKLSMHESAARMNQTVTSKRFNRSRFCPHFLLIALVTIFTMPFGRLSAADKTAVEIPPGLANYVSRPEPKFRWELRDKQVAGGATIYDLALVSQEWQTIVWEHQLQVYQPADAAPAATMLLWNQGGQAGEGSIAFGM